jgi:hypothetical protein
MNRFIGTALFVVLSSSISQAQSFNIDIGQPGTGPADTYRAAGRAGFWNAIRAEHISGSPSPHPSDYFLKDVHGNSTSVRVHQFGGTELLSANDPSVSGDDAALLNDTLITHSIPLKICLFFNGLPVGDYEVLTYAWMPNHPEIDTIVFHDFTPGTAFVGGAWPGQHEEGVTYARHIVHVSTGFMGPHSGLPNGGNTVIGGAMNGMQLRKVGPAGDPDNDGDVDDADFVEFVRCQSTPGDHSILPGCIEFDGDDDDDVDMKNFVAFQNLFTGSE